MRFLADYRSIFSGEHAATGQGHDCRTSELIRQCGNATASAVARWGAAPSAGTKIPSRDHTITRRSGGISDAWQRCVGRWTSSLTAPPTVGDCNPRPRGTGTH